MNVVKIVPTWQNKNQKDFNMLDLKLTKLVLMETNDSKPTSPRIK